MYRPPTKNSTEWKKFSLEMTYYGLVTMLQEKATKKIAKKSECIRVLNAILYIPSAPSFDRKFYFRTTIREDFL